MNKNIKLAVAGAVLALSASAANAGIIIPAGEWTVDIGGNVNTYATWSKANGNATIGSATGVEVGAGHNTTNGFGNGLLPNFLSVSGSTRQNDLDVSFTISIQPGSAHSSPLGVGADGGINNRQSFITFGDKSWGSVKVGKDLGIFASDAILSDMTLLGVGAGTPGGNTTLGRIGYGYMYADWKPQISYTTPNMSGFQATVGVSQAFVAKTTLRNSTGSGSVYTAGATNASPAFEGKASYSFAANDVSGKIWVSGISQKIGSWGNSKGVNVDGDATTLHAGNEDNVAYAGDIGVNLKAAGFDLTGYYYAGSGIGITGQMYDGYGWQGSGLGARDSEGGYVQAMYTLPTKTKIGASWGISKLDRTGDESSNNWGTLLVKENEMWTVGAYHPLTKHLNLVAEYNHTRSENQQSDENKANSVSLGAILFF